MAEPNKTKAHHSFLRNDAPGCNVARFQKSGKGGEKILQAPTSRLKLKRQAMPVLFSAKKTCRN